MSVKELAAVIGKEGKIYLNGLTIDVRILNAKIAYGRTRYQVTPLSGQNQIWVESVVIEAEAN